MREILYRGKRTDNDEWIYGWYFLDTTGEIAAHYIKDIIDLLNFEVNPETIGQYIGIKDIHQKKVFQGDIVKVKETVYTDCWRDEIENTVEFIGEVVWHQYGWHIAEKIKQMIQGKIIDGIRYHSLWLWNVKDDETDPNTHFMEILGDRYSNPEMKVIE